MEYNTQRPQLKISDYGRNIYKLIEYAKTVEDRDKRNQMAAAIVDIMSRVSTDEKVDYLLEMRASCRNRVQDYADKFGVPFFAGKRPWEVKADIYMPCATQNEVDIADAKNIVANGSKYYVEVANMPTTLEAVEYLRANGVIVAPSKAVNAGGVAVSGLEMSQNSMRYNWTAEEVDAKLHSIMKNIFSASVKAANEYGLGDDLIAGANIAGFLKVAEAMLWQGLV